MIRAWVFLLTTCVTAAQGQVLEFPANAVQQSSVSSPFDSYDVPVAFWADGTLPVTPVEGALTREAWRIDDRTLTTLQLLRPLREQLQSDGFRIIFECQTEACGGFDFRFATPTLPPPDMQINIGDFRFLTAARATAEDQEYIMLFVSRTARAGYVQITSVTPAQQADTAESGAPSVGKSDDDAPSDLAAQLDSQGRAVLSDLEFATASAQLRAGAFQSLADVAAYLVVHPERSVALVGHTDASGALDVNIALSRRRATAVAERLVADYGVNPRQISAEGMGFLAPIASNLTAQGRDANRRVEVIITATQ